MTTVTADPVPSALSPGEARSLTDEVKSDAERLWRKLVELYDGGAHLALGYSSWATYFETEFGGSKSHGYRMLEAARVAKALSHSPMGEQPNERQARELVPLLDDEQALIDAWREAQTEAEKYDHKLTARVVHNAVRKRVARIKRDAIAKENLERVHTCDGCGTSATLGKRIGWEFTVRTGGIQDWCRACAARRRDHKREEHERRLAARSRAEIEAEANWIAREKLKGSLRTFCDPYGEGGIAAYLRSELEALRTVEAWRQPELVDRIAAVVVTIEGAAREILEWTVDPAVREAPPRHSGQAA